VIKGDYAVKTLADHLTGAICLALLMLLCTLFVKGGFGGGDIKLMAASGLYLAFDNTLLGAFIAFLIAGGYSLILLIKNGREGLGRSKIRLAPFLALGLGFAALYGDQVLVLLKLASRHIFLGN
ncbi:MAG: prepilin peptidase, partial [Saccharofermentans sp.]|nr:prepilin peptidase [Saccharofermentans sp.]